MDNAYVQGFMNKCAEYGLDPVKVAQALGDRQYLNESGTSWVQIPKKVSTPAPTNQVPQASTNMPAIKPVVPKAITPPPVTTNVPAMKSPVAPAAKPAPSTTPAVNTAYPQYKTKADYINAIDTATSKGNPEEADRLSSDMFQKFK